MYICICSSVTDRQIREAIDRGADSMDDLRESLGVANCCGRCADCARRLLQERQAQCWNDAALALA